MTVGVGAFSVLRYDQQQLSVRVVSMASMLSSASSLLRSYGNPSILSRRVVLAQQLANMITNRYSLGRQLHMEHHAPVSSTSSSNYHQSYHIIILVITTRILFILSVGVCSRL